MRILCSSHAALSLVASGLFCLVTAQAPSILSNTTTPNLNLTTIAARDGCSILQCWSIPQFTESATAGTAGALNLFLGETSNASYTVIPPRFNGGVHRAPAPQLVLFTTGLAHLTLPNTTAPESSAWITGGKYGLILALDTPDVSEFGHITTYPGAADTIALQVPFSLQGIEQLRSVRKVLYEGGCQESEMVGI